MLIFKKIKECHKQWQMDRLTKRLFKDFAKNQFVNCRCEFYFNTGKLAFSAKKPSSAEELAALLRLAADLLEDTLEDCEVIDREDVF